MSDDVTIGSGNVFADLGLNYPQQELLKAKLARKLRSIVKQRNLDLTAGSRLLGVEESELSAILHGRTGTVSIDHLVRCVDRLDYDVDLVVRHKSNPRRVQLSV